MKNLPAISSKVPPQAIDVEQAVLGALMLERDAYYHVSNFLTKDCFYDTNHQEIFQAITNIAKTGRPIDLLIVTTELKAQGKLDEIGGPLYVTQLTNYVSTALHIEHHARIIKQKAIARELIRITAEKNEQAYNQSIDIDETLSELQNDLIKLLETGNNKESSISDAIREIESRIAQNRTSNGLTGIGTGLFKFDKFTGGMQPTDLIIIAAESSQGKTSLALTMLKNAVLRYKAKAAIYSLEMSKAQLTARIISQESGIPAKNILNKSLSDADLSIVMNVASQLQKLPIYFDERSTNSIDHICNSIRKLKLKYDIDLVIVDYLQLVNSNLKNRTDESQIADIARRLKNTAKELGITIIALSQLSREKDPKPTKNRLRGSGQIEEAADIILLLWRPEEYKIQEFDGPFNGISTIGLAETIIAKGRNIGTGAFLLRFNKETTGFYDYTPEYQQAPEYNPNHTIEPQDEPF